MRAMKTSYPVRVLVGELTTSMQNVVPINGTPTTVAGANSICAHTVLVLAILAGQFFVFIAASHRFFGRISFPIEAIDATGLSAIFLVNRILWRRRRIRADHGLNADSAPPQFESGSQVWPPTPHEREYPSDGEPMDPGQLTLPGFD